MVLPHHDADRMGCVSEGSKESECSKNAPEGSRCQCFVLLTGLKQLVFGQLSSDARYKTCNELCLLVSHLVHGTLRIPTGTFVFQRYNISSKKCWQTKL